MKVAVFAFSRRGCDTARKILTCFPDAEQKAYTMERFQENGFLPFLHPSKTFYGELFAWADAMIFVGSAGIAVREIAPHVKDKRTDPAVICADDGGKYVIPLLSGHIGGANELAKQIAKTLCAVPVITTATDVNHRFSVDTWATKNGFIIDKMALAKAVSAEILERDIPVCSDFPVMSDYPKGVVPGEEGELGICLSWEKKTPFKRTLRLIPPVLHLGIGCRKGTEAETIDQAVEQVLDTYRIDKRAIKCVASIDLKKEEKGLLTYAEKNQWQTVFYKAEELQAAKGDFTPSSFVKDVTGVDNVCERAAAMGAKRLIVKKTAINGVTIAIAAEHLEVHFG